MPHMITRRTALVAPLVATLGGPAARAQGRPLRIGVLNDQSSFYADSGGRGGVVAVRMAVQDFGGTVLGRPIEILSADHQNKADIASTVARRWFDADSVEVIVDLPNTATALAAQQAGLERQKVTLVTGAGGTALIGKQCSPTSVQWTYSSYATARAIVAPVLASGGDTWFFITADYVGGIALEDGAKRFILAGGGKVVGSARHPVGTTDYASFILQATSSGAKVVAMASGGQDMQNVARQAREFGLGRDGRQTLVATAAFVTDIHALGLEAAQGLRVPASFYWDMNDGTRAWSKRFFAQVNRMPTMLQAANYCAVSHYLAAVKATGTTDGPTVMAKMRATPVHDFMTTNGTIRSDGYLMREMRLFEVKKPVESSGEWDLYRQIGIVSAEDAAYPLSEGECPFAKP